MRKIAMASITLFLFACAAGLASPQTKTTHKKTRTLTGCLQKSDSADEYKLVAANGATWEVKGDGVNLGEHVGHKVSVTGVVSHNKMHGMKEDAKDEAKEHGVAKNSTEHGHMTVTDVKMVSESCSM